MHLLFDSVLISNLGLHCILHVLPALPNYILASLILVDALYNFQVFHNHRLNDLRCRSSIIKLQFPQSLAMLCNCGE